MKKLDEQFIELAEKQGIKFQDVEIVKDKLSCEHKMTIFESYETYAVCSLCGVHDWSSPSKGEVSMDTTLKYFTDKYPDATVERFGFEGL